jgi:hypothetical protein
VWEQRYEVLNSRVLTELQDTSERVLDPSQWDIGDDDGVLIPGRVIDVEQASLAAILETKAYSLVVVGPPTGAELVIDAEKGSVGSGERNRAPPFKSWLPAGDVLREPVQVFDWIAGVDVVVFVASQRDQLVGDDLGLGRN